MTTRELLRAVASHFDIHATDDGHPMRSDDTVTAAALRAIADRFDAEDKALTTRAHDKLDPMRDYAFCALNLLARLDGPVTPEVKP